VGQLYLFRKEESHMADSVITHPSLLLRIRDTNDRQAWSEFVDIYAPLVHAFACKHGLQDADAADLTQDVLRAVAGAIGRFEYDSERGTFRGWLFTIVRNRLRNFLTARRRHGESIGGRTAREALDEVPSREQDAERLWESDYERRLFEWAAEQVHRDCSEQTWQAFWRTAVDGHTGQQVARALGMSTAAVYLAKRRVMERLKEFLRLVQDE
jgi:RNA polymerase sigma-70 factor (ECF subfamily)